MDSSSVFSQVNAHLPCLPITPSPVKSTVSTGKSVEKKPLFCYNTVSNAV